MPPVVARQHRGFTLLEVLVVISIMGVVIGIASYALGSLGHRRFQSESQQLQVVLNHLADQALMRQQYLRWVYDEESGQCQTEVFGNNGEWEPLPARRPFRCAFDAIRAVEIETAIEPRHRNIREEADVVGLYFLPTGRYSAFSLSLIDSDKQTVVLHGDGLNLIVLGAGT